MSPKPNFFIIGAPKCGTSSIAAWLSAHPQVFVTEPKEPEFFDSDRNKNFVPTAAQYERFFRGVEAKHIAVGEASTAYLRSQVAVPNILRYAPNAKFIVGLRNPVEMSLSWHGQTVFEGWETERDFEQAWRRQESRRLGLSVPERCPDVNNLMYGNVCKLGEQVARLRNLVPKERILFYALEELNRPRVLYARLLKFLGAADDGRNDFPSVNTARALPSWMAQTSVSIARIKLRLGLEGVSLGLVGKLQNRLSRRRNVSVSPVFQEELRAYFEDDILLLAKLVDIDLSQWTALSLGVTEASQAGVRSA